MIAHSRHGDEIEHQRLIANEYRRQISEGITQAMMDGTADRLADVTIVWRQRPLFETAPLSKYDITEPRLVDVPGWSSMQIYSRLTISA